MYRYPQLPCEQLSIVTVINTQLTLNGHSIDAWSINPLMYIDPKLVHSRPTLDRVSYNCQSRCWSNIDQVTIKNVINTWPLTPLAHTIQLTDRVWNDITSSARILWGPYKHFSKYLSKDPCKYLSMDSAMWKDLCKSLKGFIVNF